MKLLFSVNYFYILAIALFLYYTIGKKIQKYLLLAFSLLCYWLMVIVCDGNTAANVLFNIGLIVVLAYSGGIAIDKAEDKNRGLITKVFISIIVFQIFYLKNTLYLGDLCMPYLVDWHLVSGKNLIKPLGYSFISISAIGYLLDVYWKTYKAEKNPCDVLLFILFFPVTFLGPVLRFNLLQEQIISEKKFCFNNLICGLERMLWGYLKKLVIAERLNFVVNSVFDNYSIFGGTEILLASFIFLLQLYFDFSGCIDIVLGTAKLFDINLPENFEAPLSANSFKEFWRRWHMSLGGWFRDYVMYPLLKSNAFLNLGRFCRKKIGKEIGKKIPFYLSMFSLWLLLGTWHGKSLNLFLGASLVPFIITTLSDLWETFWPKLTVHEKTKQTSAYQCFQVIRTMFLVSLVCLMFRASDFSALQNMLNIIFTNYTNCQYKQLNYSIFGITGMDLYIILSGLILAVVIDNSQFFKNQYISFGGKTKNLLRCTFACIEILMIVYFGITQVSEIMYLRF